MGLSQLHLLSNTSELSSEAFHPRFETIWISKRLKFKTTNILAFFCVFHLQRYLDLKGKTWPAWEFLNQKKTQILPTSAANWLGSVCFVGLLLWYCAYVVPNWVISNDIVRKQPLDIFSASS
jgi:hypothetical protein